MRLHPYTGEVLTPESFTEAYAEGDATLRWLLDYEASRAPELLEVREQVVKAARDRLTGRLIVNEKGERHGA
jgi:hypothetical protein